MSKKAVNFLLAQEFPVKFWSSLLSRNVSCTVQEIEEVITSLDGSSKRLVDFIAPKKKLKVNLSLLNLAFSFPVVVLSQSSTSGSSFNELRPKFRDRILLPSQAVFLLNSSFGSSIAVIT